jgi:hypothetical protein
MESHGNGKGRLTNRRRLGERIYTQMKKTEDIFTATSPASLDAMLFALHHQRQNKHILWFLVSPYLHDLRN